MTTYAYRDGIMASDTAVSCGDMVVGNTVKIVQRKGYFAAASGTASLAQEFIRWFDNGMKGQHPPMYVPGGEDGKGHSCYGVIICPDDKIICLEPSGAHWHYAPFFADGSGSKLAMGAMAVGANAEEAIRAAAKFDVFTREPITVLRRMA